MCPQRLEFTLNQPSANKVDEGGISQFALILDVPGWTAAPAPMRLNRDNLAERITEINPELSVELELAGTQHIAVLKLNDPEDLEPDAIAGQLGLVQRLQALRKRLQNNDDAEAAALELRDFLGTSAAESDDKPEPPSLASPATDPDPTDDSFSALLGEGRSKSTPQTSFVHKLLAGNFESIADHSALIEACNGLINSLVNQVLQDPDFQAIERRWQGVSWLSSMLDLDDETCLWVVPIDFSRLSVAALSEESQPEFENTIALLHTALQRVVAGADGGTLTAIALDTGFESPESIGVLAGFAEMARGLSCVVLAKAPCGLTGSGSTLQLEAGYPRHDLALQQIWDALREQPAARHCAAVLPRLLLRLPYGTRGEPTYLADFEELEPGPDHDRFPWINPVYGLIYLMAREEAAEDLTISDLPMPVYDDGSGDSVMPCAEAYLTEADTAKLHENGIMVFQSFRNRNAVKLSGMFTLG